MPHWNWDGHEGELIDVRCYSNASEVELLLNGRSLGRKTMECNSRLDWQVPYEGGELEAVGYGEDGRETARHARRTAKAPAALELSSGFGWLKPSGDAIIVVDAAIVDRDGETCPRAANQIAFIVDGPVDVLGAGNGNPLSHEPDKGTKRSAFHGLCQVIMKAAQPCPAATLRAVSPGLKPAAFSLGA